MGIASRIGSRGAASRWTQGPGSDHEGGEDDRGHQRDGGITYCQVGGGGSRVVKDKAGVGPLLEPGKTRSEQSHPGQHIPYADDSHEVAQVLHDPDERWYSQRAHHSSHQALGSDEHSDDSVGDEAPSGPVGGAGEFGHEKCHIRLGFVRYYNDVT
jgi:hypothetical protein